MQEFGPTEESDFWVCALLYTLASYKMRGADPVFGSNNVELAVPIGFSPILANYGLNGGEQYGEPFVHRHIPNLRI